MTSRTQESESAAESGRPAVKAAWAVSFLTMASRVLGYARLILTVQMFSSMRWASDAFIFAFRIPNLFRNLLGEGALSASAIPVFVRTHEKGGKTSASEFGSQIFTLLAVVSGAVCALGIAVCLALDLIYAGGDDKELLLGLRLTAILFPFMPLVCMAALLGGMLQGLRRFTVPALLSVILNAGFLAAFAYVYWVQCGGNLANLRPDASTYAISVFVLAAGIVEVAVQIPLLRASGIRIAPAFSFGHPGLREAVKAFAPAALGLGAVQLNAFVDSLIAGGLSLQSTGAVTYLEIGARFMQLPLGVFGAAIAVTAFPDFASCAAKKDGDGLAKRLVKSLRMSMFLILPASAVLIAMADPIVRLTCQRPDLDFDNAAVYRASLVLILYSCGLVFYNMQQILIRVYYACGDYSRPLRICLAMVGLNLVLNLLLVNAPDLYRMFAPDYYAYWHLSPESFGFGGRLGEAGLALATCITAIVNVALLAAGLRKRLPSALGGVWGDPELLRTAARMVLAAAGAGVLCWLYRNSIPYAPEFLPLLERVAVPCVLAGFTFYLICILLPVPEFDEFVGGLLRKKGRASKGSEERDSGAK